ncbi:MAG: hypothetical protein Hyperionvirus23_41 [Hyperionvirus sp.]|uniref:Uncharacterized protein n=1 Tax=Hyperionvirus sp. TaxID=2487770 RepID=A0A3G5ACP5_9VIRU|nr:MAG: hypothetical protein Hyperionvirus23_41 [Hyperionvirus sp.]
MQNKSDNNYFQTLNVFITAQKKPIAHRDASYIDYRNLKMLEDANYLKLKAVRLSEMIYSYNMTCIKIIMYLGMVKIYGIMWNL